MLNDCANFLERQLFPKQEIVETTDHLKQSKTRGEKKKKNFKAMRKTELKWKDAMKKNQMTAF